MRIYMFLKNIISNSYSRWFCGMVILIVGWKWAKAWLVHWRCVFLLYIFKHIGCSCKNKQICHRWQRAKWKWKNLCVHLAFHWCILELWTRDAKMSIQQARWWLNFSDASGLFLHHLHRLFPVSQYEIEQQHKASSYSYSEDWYSIALNLDCNIS